MNFEGIQHIDSNNWDEGNNSSGPSCSPSGIGGGRHSISRTKDFLCAYLCKALLLSCLDTGCAVISVLLETLASPNLS